MWQCFRRVFQVFGWMDDIQNAAPSNSGLKAMDVSVLLMSRYEQESDKLQKDTFELDRQAEEIFSSLTSHISYLIILNGSGVILQNRFLSCKCAAFVVTPILMIPLVLGASHAIYVTYVKLRRLSPSRDMLTRKKRELAKRAEVIHDMESSRVSRQVKDDNLHLHDSEEVESILRRSKAIMSLTNLSRIEEGFSHLIYNSIFNGILYVVVACLLVYFTYCATDGLDGIWHKNPMMPVNSLQPR